MAALVPELLCSDLSATKEFYVGVLGFAVGYERREETFIFLTLGGTELMFEQVDGPGRRWITGPLEKPYGRGINFQIDVPELGELYAAILARAPESIYLALEEKIYGVGDHFVTQQQFLVQDPDGYLLRFARELPGDPQ